MVRRVRPCYPEGGVIGLDPGSSSGAIAYVAGDEGWAWPIEKMTTHEVWARIRLLAQVARLGVLERVHAMPKQGVSSSFKFGASFGAMDMALIAVGRLRVELVQPAKWQRAVMKKTTKGDKRVSREFAQRRFPGLHITDKTADALLIAEYGRLYLS